MADETISTRIVANADFSALIADVHKVTASLSQLQEKLAGSNKMLANQIAVMNRSFSDTMRSTGQYSTHFVSLQSDVEKFGKNLDGGKLKLNQYFNAFRDQARTSGGLIRDLAKQQVSMQNAILQPLGRNTQGLMQFNVHVPRGLDEIKNKTAITRQELQIMNKVIQDGAGQLINWGKNTQWAGRQLTVGLTVPLAAFGKAAADAFKQADAELVRLTKVYGDIGGASAAELGKIREDVIQTSREISAAMGVSFKETIALAADIAATGKTGDDLLGSIKETTRLAVLGEVDRQEAMKATLAIQTAFKQNTDELSDSINFLNAVENQTSTTLNDLVEAIPKAGPVVKALGGDIQDLALYLTAMREGGVNAAEGANAIKSSLASLINPSKVAKDMFMGFGINLEKIVQSNAGNITATIMELQGALNSLDPLNKSQAIEQLFGKFQFARLSALFENLGKQGSQTLQVLDLMKASSDELADVAGRELTAVTESASGRYNRALESLKASLASVGDQFLTINTYIIQTIDKVIQFASNLPKPVKQILTLLGGITAIAGPLIMITGVLANFFGYMAKGVFHMRAFFKGGEGWKYLTPEMLAAERAGKLVEQSFYSDAKAAAVLKQALGNLIDEFSVLEAKAKSGALSVNPAVSTMAGNLVIAAGGGRVVDPSHPLVGPMGTRASSHMVPRSGMTEAQRLQQTMFGMVPGSGPVNQKIGQNPQIYMNDNLPNVPGLTTIGGVSTGIVAEEAARHHAMMATLAMQSKEEITEMKKQMVATGTISKDLMVQFDGMLPVVSRLTDNAAKQSALIVAELRAGKINIEQAKAKIVALNLETERMIASSVQSQAATMGRTLNPTMIPTLNQPVVDATGKSNMRELFKKGSTRDFINKVASALGVRTSGAGYNIETTKPRRLNRGGNVFYNNGDQVPGPNVNADVVPAMLTPGEFVIRRGVAQQDPDGMRALNEGRAMVVPVQRNIGGVIPLLRALQTRRLSISGLRVAGERSGRQAYTPGQLNFEAISRSPRRGGTTVPRLQESGYLTKEEAASLSGMIGAHGVSRGFISNIGSRTSQGSYPTTPFEDVYNRFSLTGSMTPTGSRRSAAQRYIAEGRTAQVLPGSIVHIDDALNKTISSGTAIRADFAGMQGFQMTNLLDFLSSRRVPANLARKIATDAAAKLKSSLPSSNINERSWAKAIEKAEQSAIVKNAKELSRYTMPFDANRGGMVPGYMRGGGIPALSADVIARLTSKWKTPNIYSPLTQKYNYANTDPLHGPLFIGTTEAGKLAGRAGRESVDYRLPKDVSKGNELVGRQPIFSTDPRYLIERYMQGDKSVLARMQYEQSRGLNTHPLSIQSLFKSVAKPFRGTLYRGMTSQSVADTFPKHIVEAIEKARATGDFSALIGKDFIMRRASFSANRFIASHFAPGRSSGPMSSLLLEAKLFGRKVTPTSQMFPDTKFEAPYGQNWSTKRAPLRRRSEEESLVGGKFIITGFDGKNLIVEGRAMGGAVSGATPYMVGEKGPEIFVPQVSGKIISNKNMGGLIPSANGQKYNMGGAVQYLNKGGEAQRGMGGMGMFMGGMGLQMGGGMVGGTAGSIMSNVGMAMQFMPMLGMLPKLTGGTKLFSTAIKALTGGIKAAALAMKAFALANPILLAGTLAVAGAIAAFKAWRKEIEETRREQTNLFGITEKGAKEAGIQYESLTDKVKAVREEQKLAADTARSYFESYSISGVKGLNLTIQQLRELKERVKNDMPEMISTFNSIDTSKVSDLASNLKAQMIAGGKSVEEATNLIYALIEASDKAGMGVSSISSKAFSGITDKGSAATFVLKNLAQNIKDVSKIDAEAFASNVDSAIASLDSAVNSLIGTKDESGKVLDEAGAIALQFERIAAAGIKNNNLGGDTLAVLKRQRPEFANILNQSDTIGGMYAKWRLMLQGVSADLSQINSKQAETLSSFISGLESAGEAALAAKGTVPGLDQARKTLDRLKKSYDASSKASRGEASAGELLSKKRIKEIQDEIKAIRERAEAKKKSLRETFDKENAELELQKAKLDLQNAVARGDNESAAAAQIRIQQIQKEVSIKAAEAKIDENAKKAESKQQALLDKDQEKRDKVSDKAASSGKKAEGLNSVIQTVTELGNKLAEVAKLRALSSTEGATKEQKDAFTRSFSNVLNDIAIAAKSNPKVLEAYGQYLTKDVKQKDGFARDSKGNFIPLPANERTGIIPLKTGLGSLPQGAALNQLDVLSKGMTDYATLITGGTTLQMLGEIFKKANGGKNIPTPSPGPAVPGARSARPMPSDNSPSSYRAAADAMNTKPGRLFTPPGGSRYIMDENGKPVYESTSPNKFKQIAKAYNTNIERKAMGGYVTRAASGISGMTGSQPYLVGERGPELFVPSSGGQIIPNNRLGVSYNIPSGGINSVRSSGNNSSNSNTYNIDIKLSGTNVTADDIMRKFKSELALVNAKEGRSRSFGGNY